ncbi:acetyl-coenzyme A transporter 1-like [Oppia nitens]|uniref:acetyl-coenzyme A transporter 1-like n=1 Tax=Oppia nitens TaxID=1686743 RepID=UPI0023D9FF67|nr:acetyl-coenzyme A transporter 1-like [Oppia nitens]
MSQQRNRSQKQMAYQQSLLESQEEVNGWSHDSHEDENKKSMKKRALRGDYMSIAVLLFLYILQGIPLGLAASIPMILTNRKVSYAEQAIFSFVSWPFSVKLLWAPIVDSVYCQAIGRRKTWLVPTQYFIGIFMLVLSYTIDNLLDNSGLGPNIYLLTTVFFALNFLAATQDIAVDGWALTMLSRENVSYASTCNTVGQTAGYFLGNVVFLALESVDFCNNYLRSEPQTTGFVTLSGFFFFWGIVFMISTSLLMIFKREKTNRLSGDEPDMGVLQTYSMLIRIFNLPSIRLFALILLTTKVGFGVTDSVTGLKLIEAGVHRENLALMAIPMTPLQIIMPWIISKYTNGPRPLSVFLKAYPIRLLFGIVFAIILWWTKYVRNPTDGSFPAYYYAVILFAYALHQIALYCMFVALMSFHARISDPLIGGTYMTLLNTITNLGGNWPQTLSLWLIDPLTRKTCSVNNMSCNDAVSLNACQASNGSCDVTTDGYYVEVVLSIIIGLLWFKWGRSKIRALQMKPMTAWKCA